MIIFLTLVKSLLFPYLHDFVIFCDLEHLFMCWVVLLKPSLAIQCCMYPSWPEWEASYPRPRGGHPGLPGRQDTHWMEANYPSTPSQRISTCFGSVCAQVTQLSCLLLLFLCIFSKWWLLSEGRVRESMAFYYKGEGGGQILTLNDKGGWINTVEYNREQSTVRYGTDWVVEFCTVMSIAGTRKAWTSLCILRISIICFHQRWQQQIHNITDATRR